MHRTETEKKNENCTARGIGRRRGSRVTWREGERRVAFVQGENVAKYGFDNVLFCWCRQWFWETEETTGDPLWSASTWSRSSFGVVGGVGGGGERLLVCWRGGWWDCFGLIGLCWLASFDFIWFHLVLVIFLTTTINDTFVTAQSDRLAIHSFHWPPTRYCLHVLVHSCTSLWAVPRHQMMEYVCGGMNKMKS